MTLRHTSEPRYSRGFTLVELLVVMAIATILVSIAVASYTSQVQKSRRTDAKTALLDLAGREESYFSVNNSYASDWSLIGYAAAATPSTTGLPVGSGYYNVYGCVPAGGGPAPCPGAGPAAPSFQMVATPLGSQVNDTSCQVLVVDSTGKQSSTDGSGNDTTATCWK
jgi:type IV pilus assembly protein PilE